MKNYKHICLILFGLSCAVYFYMKIASPFAKDFSKEYQEKRTFYEKLKNHYPVINWKEKDVIGCPLSEEEKKDIMSSYREAWFSWNKMLLTHESYGIQDYFSKELLEDFELLKINKENDFRIERIDLEHNIEPYLYSLDRQVFAFKDRMVKIRKRTYKGKELISTREDFISYEVLMILEYGKWKIKQMKIIENDSKVLLLLKKSKTRKVESDAFLKNLSHIKDIVGINYYPKDSPWMEFWENFDVDVVNNDLKEISSLGFNTIRIFVPNDGLVKNMSFYDIIEKMESLLKLADDHGLKVLPTLFDFPSSFDFDSYTYYERQLMAMLTHFKNNEIIIGWDLKNEPDLDFIIHGESKVLECLDYLIDRARIYDDKHPITVGWADASHALYFENKLDFVCFHFYNKPKQLRNVIERIKSNTEKPILLEEYGTPSYPFSYPLLKNKQTIQAAQTTTVLNICKESNIPFMLWTFYDFNELPYKVFSWKKWTESKQKHYGLKDKNGSPKEVYYSIKNQLVPSEVD